MKKKRALIKLGVNGRQQQSTRQFVIPSVICLACLISFFSVATSLFPPSPAAHNPRNHHLVAAHPQQFFDPFAAHYVPRRPLRHDVLAMQRHNQVLHAGCRTRQILGLLRRPLRPAVLRGNPGGGVARDDEIPVDRSPLEPLPCRAAFVAGLF